jgi:hypothetical protein
VKAYLSLRNDALQCAFTGIREDNMTKQKPKNRDEADDMQRREQRQRQQKADEATKPQEELEKPNDKHG